MFTTVDCADVSIATVRGHTVPVICVAVTDVALANVPDVHVMPDESVMTVADVNTIESRLDCTTTAALLAVVPAVIESVTASEMIWPTAAVFDQPGVSSVNATTIVGVAGGTTNESCDAGVALTARARAPLDVGALE